MQNWSNNHRRASREIQKEQLRARLQTGRGRRVGGALLTGSGIPGTGGPRSRNGRISRVTPVLLPPDGMYRRIARRVELPNANLYSLQRTSLMVDGLLMVVIGVAQWAA